MSAAAAIEVEDVVRDYVTPAGPVRALAGVTLRVEPDTSVAITGPSGCGKSTLLGLIAGLESPTAGRIAIGDVELSELSDRARTHLRRERFGLVFQADNLLPFLSVVENVALRVAMTAAGDGYERCSALLEQLGLGEHRHKLPDQLSGGQRQRVAIAGALVGNPVVILADEPTGSLDPAGSAAVIDALLDARQAAGATLVLVTHDPDVAKRMDRTIGLRDGRLVGPEAEVRERSGA